MPTHKRILITGASSGIGRALAIKAAEGKHSLLLLARRQKELQSLVKECKEIGCSDIRIEVRDISLFEDLEPVMSKFEQLKNREPVLINNAGMAEFGSFHEIDFSKHRKQIQTNLLGSIQLTHAMIPMMLNFGSGMVVNVLSIATEHTFPGAAIYSASKSGLEQFGKCLSAEYRQQGIRVTNIHPGAVNTPLWGDGASPPKEKMLTDERVAEIIYRQITSKADHVVEKIVVTPLEGIL